MLLVLYCCSCFFAYILSILMFVCKLCISFDRKKKWASVRDTLFSGTYTYVSNFWSKDNNHKKVIVINFRTGCKFQYY